MQQGKQGMKRWKIEYWVSSVSGTPKGPIEKWLDGLTKEQLKSVSKELAILMELGNTLRLPHSRALGNKLFELRERTFGYRIYYTFCSNRLIIVLAAGDKASQERDIHTARKRLSLLEDSLHED